MRADRCERLLLQDGPRLPEERTEEKRQGFLEWKGVLREERGGGRERGEEREGEERERERG